ncbi:MAG TPA: hypothetical protein VF995_04660 [Actinomycetota bacterium]
MSAMEAASRPLSCGVDLVGLMWQVADGEPGDLAHQAGCQVCQAALVELRRLWVLVGELAAERVAAPDKIDRVTMQRIRRALFAAKVAEFFSGLLPRLGWALLTYSGFARGR